MAFSLTSSGLTLGSDVFNDKKDIGLAAYPVGSIYMSVNSTSPATLFGGTWEALDEGRVLIGCNATYPAGSIGGEFEHTLTVDEMPSHNHVINTYSGTGGERGFRGGDDKNNNRSTEHTGGSQPLYKFRRNYGKGLYCLSLL